MPAPYAVLADLAARYPEELVLLAADETTGLRDDARIDRALEDATDEVRAILQARYTPAELDQLDEASIRTVRLYTMDIALHRIALAFSRQTEAINTRRDQAVRRLEAIAAGKGALTILGQPSVGTEPGASPNVVIVDAPERVFTRRRFGALS